MNKSFLVLTAVVLLVSTACSKDDNENVENLLQNASFEEGSLGPNGADHWGFLETGDIVTGSAHPNAGNRVLRITFHPDTWNDTHQNGHRQYRIAQTIRNLQPGEEIEFSVWIRSENLIDMDETRGGRVPVLLKAWAGQIGNSNFDTFLVPSGRMPESTNPWQQYSGTWVLPDRFGGLLQVVLFPINNAEGSVIYYDDLRLKRNTSR